MYLPRLLSSVALMTSLCMLAYAEEPAIEMPLASIEGVGLDGKLVSSTKLLEKGPVVLIVMRGFPGYDCPACSAQLADFVKQSDAFKAAGAQIMIVYPGSIQDLEAKAKGFVSKQQLTDSFHLVIDKELKIVKQLGLFWDAPKETAYPTTLVADRQGKIRFVKISRTHGGRTKAAEVIAALEKASS